MGRYTTLTEEIQRINGMAAIKTQPPCGCTKPEDGKEIITSANTGGAVDESDEATQRDKFFADMEAQAGQVQRLPETGIAPNLNPNPKVWQEAVDLYNKIKQRS
jgi:hypothetical protein